ncbi:hypothetical protein NXT08_06240 [Rhodococcus pyridinivorans]|uniref:T3SS (YopN, CesT) and YbjN peptide-binding chaperone 1 n=1 Tax=Rhodococcus pyridinivorans TaxID=103816 RepID=UPI0021642618|nr:hypothetical protein [Rhodococcus pyridinivorans]UVT26194.1 hypothetical protein NXT08_06240 [Rhodococcus pyridinivorans]
MADAQTRFDQDVDAAWREFRTRLADHVAAMSDGDGLVLEPFTDEAGGPAGPCVQFYAWGDRLIRCEVPSNAHLAPDRHLTPVDEQMLLELGLKAPSRGPDDPEDDGSPAFWIDRPGSWADQLAVIAVRALRSVWGVPHPLFLRAETFGTERSVAELTSFLVPETPQAGRTQAPEVPLAVVPSGDDHVRELIESTLHERIDDLPAWDEDGDLVLRIAGVLVFVGVGPGGGTVDLFAPIVHSITGRTRAAEICVDLNRRWPHLKFVLVDDRLAIVDHVPAAPFAPAHLLGSLETITRFLDTVDSSFATHIGGSLLRDQGFDGATGGAADPPWGDVSQLPDAEDDLPVALLAVRDFHLDGATDVAASTVAAIGDRNPEQLRRFLTISTELQVWWDGESQTREAALNTDGAREARARALEWEATSRSLAEALQFLEQGEGTDSAGSRASKPSAGRESAPEQPALFDNPDEPTLFDGFGDYS